MRRTIVATLAAFLGAGLYLALRSLVGDRARVGDLALAGATREGIENPLTAVLLLFRAHDTWLELVVVTAALFGLLALERGAEVARVTLGVESERLLRSFAHLLFPWTILLAAYLVWLGTKEPGGAFQGGVVAASGLILLFFANRRVFGRLAGWRFRFLASFALAVPLALTLPGLVRGDPLLTYPAGDPTAWIVVIETAITIGLTVELAALVVVGARGFRSAETGPAPPDGEA